jgi:flagellar hook protein FlgE
MMRSLYSGVTGLNANKQYMETIGDNIANVNTPGFKSSSPSFANVLNQTTNIVSSNVNSGFSGNEIGNGVAVVGLRFDWTQGPLQSTGNATDLSINGGGFFRVADDTESFYTRAGDFSFDKDGNLITLSGMNVQGFNILTNGDPDPAAPYAPENISIDLDQWESITVDNNGLFYGVDSTLPDTDPNYGQPQALYQVSLYEFANINGLGKMSNNLWRQTADSGDAVLGVPGDGDFGNVISSTLEISNVDLATEFVNMITAQRAFQANSRVITTSDEMLAELINIKR